MVAKRKPDPASPSCREKVYEIGWEDLPLSCPTPEMTVWNAHPRVFLPIHRSGEATCSYCGSRFVLKDPAPDQPMPQFDNTEIEDRFRRAQQRVRDATS
jgi:uncharacterized Zn-finger protein